MESGVNLCEQQFASSRWKMWRAAESASTSLNRCDLLRNIYKYPRVRSLAHTHAHTHIQPYTRPCLILWSLQGRCFLFIFPAADCYCNKTYGLIFSRSSHLKHPGQQLPQQEQEVMVVVGPTPCPPPTLNPGPTICPSYISVEQTGGPSGAAQRVQMILPSVNKDESCKRKSIKDELYALRPPSPSTPLQEL